MNKIIKITGKVFFVIFFLLYGISLFVPVMSMTIGEGANAQTTAVYAYNIFSSTLTSSENGMMTSSFFGLLSIALFISATILLFIKNRTIKYIAVGIQFAYFAIIVPSLKEVYNALGNIPSSYGIVLNYGGFYFHICAVSLLILTSLVYLLFDTFFKDYDFDKLVASKNTSNKDKLKQLYQDGIITKEEYVAKLLGEENETR